MTNLQAIDLLKGLEQSLDDYCELNDEGKTAFRMAITALEVFGNSEQLPSAEPEPKKGEWINKEFYGIGEGSAECSICHKRSSGYKEDDGWGVHCLFHDFCPNCGADMRGKEDE